LKYSVAKLNAGALSADLILDPTLLGCVIDYDDLELGKVLGQGAEAMVYQGAYATSPVAVKVALLPVYSIIPGIVYRPKCIVL
jgi:hypothetical protein